jgi:hypothetical protein
MSQEAVPDWLRNNGKGDAEPLNNMESDVPAAVAPKDRDTKSKMFYYGRKIITMGLCLLMAGTSLIGLSKTE